MTPCPEDGLEFVHQAHLSVTQLFPGDLHKAEQLLERALKLCPGNDEVVDAVINFHRPTTGPSEGYYGLIWLALSGDPDYRTAFRYYQRIVELLPNLALEMINASEGLRAISKCAGRDKNWNFVRTMLEYALARAPLGRHAVGNLYIDFAGDAGQAGDLEYARVFMDRAEVLLSLAGSQNLIGGGAGLIEAGKKPASQNVTVPGPEAALPGGSGYLGLALKAFSRGQKDLGKQCADKALSYARRTPQYGRSLGFWELAVWADSNDEGQLAHDCLDFIYNVLKMRDLGHASDRLARKYKLC